MTLKKQKYYVVWHGHTPGIYSTWEQCQAQVKNYPNAIYKSFATMSEAKEAFSTTPAFKKRKIFKKEHEANSTSKDIIKASISVDAACSGNPGVMEYRGVWTADKTELFHYGPVKNGTNNIGEFLAIVHALALLQKRNDTATPIYTDSKTAISWVRKKKAKTLLKQDESNRALFDMIRRAEVWLKDHSWSNPLLKWDTKRWGEIPADFGRK